MSTNSRIAVKLGKGKYKSIYSHWDGYPSWNGKLLKENYTTLDKVIELIELGSISVLGVKVGKKVDFDSFDSNKNKNTLAYHRDSGEVLQIDSHKTLKEIPSEEYIYLFRNGKWYVKRDNWKGFRLLTDKIIDKN